MQFRIFALLVGHILEAGLTTGEKAEDATYCAHATGSFRTFNIRYDRLEVALVSCALAFSILGRVLNLGSSLPGISPVELSACRNAILYLPMLLRRLVPKIKLGPRDGLLNERGRELILERSHSCGNRVGGWPGLKRLEVFDMAREERITVKEL